MENGDRRTHKRGHHIDGEHPAKKGKVARTASTHLALLHQLPADLFRLIILKYLKPCFTLVLLMVNRETQLRVSSCLYFISFRYPLSLAGHRDCVEKLYRTALVDGNIKFLDWLATQWDPKSTLLHMISFDKPIDACRSDNFAEALAWLKARLSPYLSWSQKARICYRILPSAIKHARVATVIDELRQHRDDEDLAKLCYSRVLKSGHVDVVKAVLEEFQGEYVDYDEPSAAPDINLTDIASHCKSAELMRRVVRDGGIIEAHILSQAIARRNFEVVRYLFNMGGHFRADAVNYDNQNRISKADINPYQILATGVPDIIENFFGDQKSALVLAPNQFFASGAYVRWYMNTHKTLHGEYPSEDSDFAALIRNRLSVYTGSNRGTLKALCKANNWSNYTHIAFLVVSSIGIHKDLVYMLKTLPPSKIKLDEGDGSIIEDILFALKCRYSMWSLTDSHKAIELKKWHVVEFLRHEYDCDIRDRVSERVRARQE